MGARLARARPAVTLIAGALLVFEALAREAMERDHFHWDTLALATVGRFENDAFEAVMVVFSFLGAGVGLLLLLGAMLVALLRRGRVPDVLFVTISLLVAQVAGRVVKDAVDKPRPPRPDHEELHLLVDLRHAVVLLVGGAVILALATRWRSLALAFSAVLASCILVYEVLAPGAFAAENRSFPSGHATSSMAVTAAAIVLAWPTPRRRAALLAGAAFVVLVGLSRIAVGVHYPSDILGGWCLAIACVAFVWLIIRPGGRAEAVAAEEPSPPERPPGAGPAPWSTPLAVRRAIGCTAAALLAAVVLAACGGGGGHGATRAGASGAGPATDQSRVVVIVMENHEYDRILGSRKAPFLNQLIRSGGLATRFYGTQHPSLPNYIALTGGSTFQIKGDCRYCHVKATNLVDQLEGARISWKAYMEDMPTFCYGGAIAGDYAKKHNPFAYYDTITTNPARCRKVVPATELDGDIRAGRLPQFTWITPNLCNDMHDCKIGTGDRYLSRLVPPLERALGPHGFLVITWDEGSSDEACCRYATGGRIATILTGPDVKPGARWDVPADHYSLLRTIEQAFSLPPLRRAGCSCSPPLDGLFVRSPRLR
jgi:membrane-associated phospholipid phosphatase